MNIYFLAGMPRAGNTLFGSLMNQNPNVKVSPNSISALLMKNILTIKNEQQYQNFPDHTAVDNVINNFFKNYYEHYNCKNILDRAPWGYPEYYNIIKQVIKNRKYVILYRPFLEVLASFAAKDKPTDFETYCNRIIQGSYSSVILDSLISIENIIKEKENYVLVHYKDLVKEPSIQLKKVCDFLNIEFIEPDYNDIKQFNINQIEYDDSKLPSDYHKIKTNGIEKSKIVVEEILPKNIIEKYKNFDINFN